MCHILRCLSCVIWCQATIYCCNYWQHGGPPLPAHSHKKAGKQAAVGSWWIHNTQWRECITLQPARHFWHLNMLRNPQYCWAVVCRIKRLAVRWDVVIMSALGDREVLNVGWWQYYVEVFLYPTKYFDIYPSHNCKCWWVVEEKLLLI